MIAPNHAVSHEIDRPANDGAHARARGFGSILFAVDLSPGAEHTIARVIRLPTRRSAA